MCFCRSKWIWTIKKTCSLSNPSRNTISTPAYKKCFLKVFNDSHNMTLLTLPVCLYFFVSGSRQNRTTKRTFSLVNPDQKCHFHKTIALQQKTPIYSHSNQADDFTNCPYSHLEQRGGVEPPTELFTWLTLTRNNNSYKC